MKYGWWLKIIMTSKVYNKIGCDLKYARQQLEYINGQLQYFDQTGISKSVTEEAINRIKNVENILK